MAKLNAFLAIILVSLINSAILIAPVLAYIDIAEAAAPFNIKWSPTLSPALTDEIENCAKKISKDCKKEIFNSIHGRGAVTYSCCEGLVTMGIDCHDLLTRVMIKSLNKSKDDAAKILRKSQEIWEQCNAEVYGRI